MIAEKVGSMPTWRMSAQSYSTILLDRDADIADRASWQQDFAWLESQLRVLRDTLEPLVDGIREGDPSRD